MFGGGLGRADFVQVDSSAGAVHGESLARNTNCRAPEFPGLSSEPVNEKVLL